MAHPRRQDQGWSNVDIARLCKVSRHIVTEVCKEIEISNQSIRDLAHPSEVPSGRKITTKDGKTYDYDTLKRNVRRTNEARKSSNKPGENPNGSTSTHTDRVACPHCNGTGFIDQPVQDPVPSVEATQEEGS
jgi:hypothetical protein